MGEDFVPEGKPFTQRFSQGDEIRMCEIPGVDIVVYGKDRTPPIRGGSLPSPEKGQSERIHVGYHEHSVMVYVVALPPVGDGCLR